MEPFKFSVRSLRQAVATATGPTTFRDADLKGFIARYTATGKLSLGGERKINNKIWKFTVGNFELDQDIPAMREKVAEQFRIIRAGVDPATIELQERAKQMNLEQGLDLYLTRHPMEASSAKQFKSQMRQIGDLAKKRALDIDLADVDGLLARREKEVQQVSATKTVLICKFAMDEIIAAAGVTAVNPFGLRLKGRQQNSIPRTEHMPLSLSPQFVERLRMHNTSASRLVEALLLTGCRLSEMRNLTWPEVNLESGLIDIPKERMKNRMPFRKPITKRLREILLEQKAAFPGATWVFPSDRPANKNPTSAFRWTCDLVSSSLSHRVTRHDLRRSWSIAALRVNTPHHVIKRLMAHSVFHGDVTSLHYLGGVDIDTIGAYAQLVEDALLTGNSPV